MALEKINLGFREQLAIEKPKVKNQLTTERVNALVAEHADICTPSYKAWYCKAAYKLGVASFYQLAAQARSGDNPPNLFSKLLKEAMG